MDPARAAEPPAVPANIDLFGIPIAPLTASQVLDRVAESIRTRERLLIGVVNAAKIVNMGRDEALRQSVLEADMVLADGISVVWASRVLGRPLPERVAGIELMMEMLRRGAHGGWAIYCLGATQEVLDKMIARIGADYPGLRIAGSHHGYFKPDDEPAIAESIRKAAPDILLVGMVSPKKEQFLARWNDQLDVPVCHGVGGSFDVVSGKVQRAPDSWQRMGLEWLYRVKQEPRRLWRRYLVTNTLFCILLVKELFRGRSRVPPSSG